MVSIHRPLGYGPNTLPLRHLALALTRIRTGVSGFKVLSDNLYTIRAAFPHGELNPELSLERAIC